MDGQPKIIGKVMLWLDQISNQLNQTTIAHCKIQISMMALIGGLIAGAMPFPQRVFYLRREAEA